MADTLADAMRGRVPFTALVIYLGVCPAALAQAPPDGAGSKSTPTAVGRGIAASKAELAELTSLWNGERYADGRPKVPDDLMKRMKAVSIEEAWDVLRKKGYENQFAGGWTMLHQDRPFVGRALTAAYRAQPSGLGRVDCANRQSRGPDWALELLADRHAAKGRHLHRRRVRQAGRRDLDRRQPGQRDPCQDRDRRGV